MNARVSLMALLLKAVLLVSQVFGGQPVARIGGVEDHVVIEPGDPLEFTADTLAMDESCKWEVLPAQTKSGKATHRISPDKRTLVVFSRVGTYTLTLYVWNKDDLAKATRTIVVGAANPGPDKPTPDITPKPPPPDPNGGQDDPVEPGSSPFGLVSLVKASVAKHIPKEQRKVAGGLAIAYRDGAKKMTPLRDAVTGEELPAEWPLSKIFENQRALNHKVSGFDSATWLPVFQDIAKRLTELRADGKFASAKDAAAIWSELSLAFFGASE